MSGLSEWLRAEQARRDEADYPELRGCSFRERKSAGDGTRLWERVRTALRNGATQLAPGVLRWDSAPKCTGDVWVHTIGNCEVPLWAWAGQRREYEHAFIAAPPSRHVFISLQQKVPCRRCEHCRRQRARLWAARASIELMLAPRTWFATWTAAPEAQYRYSLGFRPDLKKDREANQAEEFRFRAAAMQRSATLALKRLRKRTGAKFRYLLVVEAHKSGLPHLHLFLHETGEEISYRDIKAAWVDGFIHAKLADKLDPSTPRYLTKYLAKSNLARVRASLHYGTPR